MGYDKFRPVCPKCGDKLKANTRYCDSCGAKTGLIPIVRIRRKRATREPVEVVSLPVPTSTRYIVREIEGYRISSANKSGQAQPGIECVVLDTLWNHKTVASFASEDQGGTLGRGSMRATARAQAATRCDLLNRLDEIAREAQGAVA